MTRISTPAVTGPRKGFLAPLVNERKTYYSVDIRDSTPAACKAVSSNVLVTHAVNRRGGTNVIMMWTAWNNGKHHTSGAGYGLKIPVTDRDDFFRRDWASVAVELPSDNGAIAIDLNVSKPSFWSSTCHEVISKEIGMWLRERGLAPWPVGQPPRLKVTAQGEGHFRVEEVAMSPSRGEKPS